MILKKPLRLAGVLVLTALAAAVPAHAADPFKPTVTGCHSSGFAGCATTLATASNLWEVEVSADGKFAYSSAFGSNAVHVFTRAAGTGALTWLACYSQPASAPCSAAIGIISPDEIELSKDGEFLYVTSWGTPGGIAVFDRDPATGTLTQFGDVKRCVSNDGTSNGAAGQCVDGRGIAGLSGMRITPDGKHLYAVTRGGDPGVAGFEIKADGSLDQMAGPAGCINNGGTDGCADGRAFTAARQIAVAPDGSAVYTGTENRGVTVLQRSAASGALSQAADTSGCITFDGASGDAGKPCAIEPRILVTGNRAQVHAAGNNVYVSSIGSIVTFSRSAGGSLTFQSCVNDGGTDGCTNVRYVPDGGYMDTTPDGQHLLVNMMGAAGTLIYARDGQGNLSSIASVDGCVTSDGSSFDEGATVPDSCVAFGPARGWGHVEVPDDQTFYTANYNGSAGLTSYRRDFYPQCQPRSIDVAYNTAKPIDLSCADRNGEDVEIAVVDVPTGGGLGAVDQAADRVNYNPFAGFSGPDSFTYRGKAGALTGEAAKVTLNVAAPPQDNDKDGVSPPADCDDGNAAIRPGAAEVPGNGVDEDCAGGDQALPPGKLRAGIDYFFDARNKRFTKVGRLDITGLIAGATLQVTCKTKKKGCKFTKKTKTFAKATAKFSAKRYFNFTKKVKKRKRKIVSKLKKGTIIEVRITAPNMIGQVVTFKTRRGKVPTFTVKCLPVGSTTPKTTC